MAHLDRRQFLILAAGTVAAAQGMPAVATGERLPKAKQPRRVVILGAGMAGLTAAHQLLEAGHEVVVLEARSRAGGRIKTIRESFADGLYGEAGAFWIPDQHELTLRYVEMLDLPLVPVEARTVLKNYYLRGTRLRIEGNGPVEWPVSMAPEERGLDPEKLVEKYLKSALEKVGDPTEPGWPPESVERYDRMSFLELLSEEGASPGAIEVMRAGYLDLWGDGIHTCSALSLLRDLKLNHLETCHKIDGGNDLLPRRLAERLGEHIRYGAPVVRIERRPDSVRALYERRGSRRSVEGDAMICTLPFSVLRGIDVTPRFSPEKRRAVEELPYTSVARIFLQSSSRFWDEQGFPGYFATDLPVGLIGDCTHYQDGRRGLLEAYVTGQSARELTAMAPQERLWSALGQMEGPYPGLGERYEGGVSKCWDKDPWARGDYAWFRPGQMATLLQAIERPEGRIHFAGEHASPWPGWIQGAIYSGHRAAREVAEGGRES